MFSIQYSPSRTVAVNKVPERFFDRLPLYEATRLSLLRGGAFELGRIETSSSVKMAAKSDRPLIMGAGLLILHDIRVIKWGYGLGTQKYN